MSLPDVRDGLTRLERVILTELDRAARELGRPDVPTALLYGRVVEHCNVSVDEMNAALARLTGRAPLGRVSRRRDRPHQPTVAGRAKRDRAPATGQ
ncbi:MAG TPA: hypothetical protein VGF45_03940 [Polyangia bacterium]